MGAFRKNQIQLLVATDVAARGIDVEHLTHVINFDMPGTVDAYTHRIGRTGRSEREGKGCTFVTHDDLPLIHAVEPLAPTPDRVTRGFADRSCWHSRPCPVSRASTFFCSRFA